MISGASVATYLYSSYQWVFTLILIRFLPKRFNRKITMYLACALFLGVLFVQYIFSLYQVNMYTWLGRNIVMFLLNIFVVSILTVTNKKQATYVSTQAFIYAQFFAALQWVAMDLIMSNTGITDSSILQYYTFPAWLSIASVILFTLTANNHERGYRLDVRKADLILLLVLTIVIFFVSNIFFIIAYEELGHNYTTEAYFNRAAINLLGVLIVFMQVEHKITLNKESEVKEFQKVFDKYYEQYKQSKESVKIANQKYHDIKHLITLIRAEVDEKLKNEYLDAFEREMKKHYLQAKTGHAVLDTIITSKYITCNQLDITFQYQADAKELNFMNVIDITSLFGNLIDNAIESVSQVEDVAKRIINLKIKSKNQFLLINVENYYEHELLYEDGSLLTTKINDKTHGYGIKSIETIAEKYNGTTTITSEDSWFRVSILFPLDQTTKIIETN